MKSAIIAAIVAAVVASGTTYAATTINGRAVAKHSIPTNRLTPNAIKAFTASTAQPRAIAAAVNSTTDHEQVTTQLVVDPQTGVMPGTYGAACPAGDVAVGGGYQTSNVGNGVVTDDSITPDGAGWTVSTGQLNATDPATITVYVSCEPS